MQPLPPIPAGTPASNQAAVTSNQTSGGNNHNTDSNHQPTRNGAEQRETTAAKRFEDIAIKGTPAKAEQAMENLINSLKEADPQDSLDPDEHSELIQKLEAEFDVAAANMHQLDEATRHDLIDRVLNATAKRFPKRKFNRALFFFHVVGGGVFVVEMMTHLVTSVVKAVWTLAGVIWELVLHLWGRLV